MLRNYATPATQGDRLIKKACLCGTRKTAVRTKDNGESFNVPRIRVRLILAVLYRKRRHGYRLFPKRVKVRRFRNRSSFFPGWNQVIPIHNRNVHAVNHRSSLCKHRSACHTDFIAVLTERYIGIDQQQSPLSFSLRYSSDLDEPVLRSTVGIILRYPSRELPFDCSGTTRPGTRALGKQTSPSTD